MRYSPWGPKELDTTEQNQDHLGWGLRVDGEKLWGPLSPHSPAQRPVTLEHSKRPDLLLSESLSSCPALSPPSRGIPTQRSERLLGDKIDS